jgi:hypothetical protein
VRRGPPGADDPDGRLVELDVDHEQHPLPDRHPQEKRPIRLEQVLDGERKRIREHGRRLAKRDAMLLQVRGGLPLVPEKSTRLVYYS